MILKISKFVKDNIIVYTIKYQILKMEIEPWTIDQVFKESLDRETLKYKNQKPMYLKK